ARKKAVLQRRLKSAKDGGSDEEVSDSQESSNASIVDDDTEYQASDRDDVDEPAEALADEAAADDDEASADEAAADEPDEAPLDEAAAGEGKPDEVAADKADGGTGKPNEVAVDEAAAECVDEPVEATSSAAVGGQVALMAVEEEFVPRAPVEISEQKDEAKPLDASQADDVVVISHTKGGSWWKRFTVLSCWSVLG
ncbi:unnamed protein product, partial [Effrenium voratum]